MGIKKTDYKERISKAIDRLSIARLRSVLDYIEYLSDREAWEETQEILSDKELMAQLEEADKDWNEGEYKEGDYVDWEKIGRNV